MMRGGEEEEDGPIGVPGTPPNPPPREEELPLDQSQVDYNEPPYYSSPRNIPDQGLQDQAPPFVSTYYRVRPPQETRMGHWTHEEEVYADKIKELFKRGKIPNCPEEITLRALLAKLLNCTPMRVSKKYAKEKALGKWVYRHIADTITTPDATTLSTDAERGRTHHEEKVPSFTTTTTTTATSDPRIVSRSPTTLSRDQEDLKQAEKDFHRSLGGVSSLRFSIFDTPKLMTLWEDAKMQQANQIQRANARNHTMQSHHLRSHHQQSHSPLAQQAQGYYTTFQANAPHHWTTHVPSGQSQPPQSYHDYGYHQPSHVYQVGPLHPHIYGSSFHPQSPYLSSDPRLTHPSYYQPAPNHWSVHGNVPQSGPDYYSHTANAATGSARNIGYGQPSFRHQQPQQQQAQQHQHHHHPQRQYTLPQQQQQQLHQLPRQEQQHAVQYLESSRNEPLPPNSYSSSPGPPNGNHSDHRSSST